MNNISQNSPTKYWHVLPSGRVQCDVCPQACKLQEGQRGVCFVRMCENKQIVLTTYGRTSGFCIDPIEKKPLNHFFPGSSAFSFGTVGCNLACKFCQNCDISKVRETDRLSAVATPKEIARTAAQYGCKSVAFTYNEPIVFMEYAIDVAKECHKHNIKTVVVTNGYVCAKPREEFFSYMDAANVDLKGFSNEFYKNIASASLQPVLDTLIYLKHHTKVWLEVTTLLIPGENDSEQEIEAQAQWMLKNLGADVPLHFSAFYPAWKMLDKLPTSINTLIRCRDIALKNGMHYVYTGNTYYPKGSMTYCHNCHKIIIARDGYQVSLYALTEERQCKNCGAKCAGMFEDNSR